MYEHLPREQLTRFLGLGDSVTLAVYDDGCLSSPHQFIQQHLHLLTLYEQQLATTNMQRLPADTGGYPFAHAVAITSEAKDGQQAHGVGSRSAYVPDQKLYIKGCRPVDNASLYFPSVVMDPVSGKCIDGRIAFGVMSAEQVTRELLASVYFMQHKWPLARVPVAVLHYRMQQTDEPAYALAFKVDNTYSRIEELFVDRGFCIADLLASNVAQAHGITVPIDQHALQLHGIALSAYLSGKATMLAKTHAHGFFRAYLNANAGNDMLRLQQENAPVVVTIVDFDTAYCVDIQLAVTSKQRIALVRNSYIEAAKSMLPTMHFVWTEEMNISQIFEAAEHEVLQGQWLSQYASALQQQLGMLHRWSEVDVEAGITLARQHPLYQQSICDAVIHSHALLHDYSPAESLYRLQF